MVPIDQPSQRDLLLDAGLELFLTKGYVGTGVREVAATAGVPQGSFTNHFRSKVAFAATVLDRYLDWLDEVMVRTLAVDGRPASDRLRDYFEEVGERLVRSKYAAGCLVPDFAAETTSVAEELRLQLAQAYRRHTTILSQALTSQGPSRNAEQRASLILAAWHGVLLRTKVERSRQPFDSFLAALDALVSMPV